MRGMKQILTALTLSLTALPAMAQSPADAARVEVLPGWGMENGHHMAALRIRLAPNWHTYWRTPGEAGIPPQFDWSGSDNVAAVRVHWPAPELHHQSGMWFLGYERDVILPLEITPRGPGEMRLAAQMEFGVCNEICVPMQATLDVPLSPNQLKESAEIKAALKDQPAPLKDARCKAEPIADGVRLTATVAVPELGGDEIAIIEHPDRSIWVSAPELHRSGGQIEVASDLVPENGKPFVVDRSALTITVVGGGQAYEARGCKG